MFIIYIFIGVIIIGVIIGLVQSSNNNSSRKAAVAAREDFTDSKVIESEYSNLYFAMDDKKQEVYCYSMSKSIRFKYCDIVEVEIKVDGDTVISNKSASLGGALVGGLVAGGLGAVVGGSSLGKSKSKRELSHINVHILLRNNDDTSFDIRLLPYPLKTDSLIYESVMKDAQDIFDNLKLAMDKLAIEQSKQAVINTPTQKSTIDELKELADLKNQGLITDEEFASVKAKIINK